MANKPISMSKVRQIIKLYSQHMGKEKIGIRLGMSKNTIRKYVETYITLKTPWDELAKLSDFELNKIFHPPLEAPVNNKLKQLIDFFPVMEKQLRKRGMTVALQYRKFKADHPDTYKETAFYKYYRQWRKRVNPSMHIEHKSGDKMYVDFAGGTLPYVEPETGEVLQAQIFVAILGWSQYAYVEAMRNQTAEEFIAGCENALHYFKGVPLAIVPDNLKSAVFKSNKYEPALNENFKCFADHYGFTILPARPRRPQDKPHVENMVKIVYQNIYTHLSEKEIPPLTELNSAILYHLFPLNDAILTDRDYSRKDQWILEQAVLYPLVETRYEMRKIKQVTVMKNGHVSLTEDHHYYSVPFELIGRKLKMQYSRSIVEIYLQYELIATHTRIRSPGNYTTNPDHMSPEHRYLTEWSPSFFLEKAKLIDPVVEQYIGEVLAKRQHVEQSYKSCQGILSFAKRVGNTRLINACRRADEIGYYNYKIIEDILKKNMDNYDNDPLPDTMPEHENIRGKNYYK